MRHEKGGREAQHPPARDETKWQPTTDREMINDNTIQSQSLAGANDKPASCDHCFAGFFRVISRDGQTQVQEYCPECGVNPRGAGVWVSRSSISVNIDALPILKDLRPQAGLFEGQS